MAFPSENKLQWTTLVCLSQSFQVGKYKCRTLVPRGSSSKPDCQRGVVHLHARSLLDKTQQCSFVFAVSSPDLSTSHPVNPDEEFRLDCPARDVPVEEFPEAL